MRRVVDWTQSAWEDIQRRRHDWLWMRKQFADFALTPGQSTYAYDAIVPAVGDQRQFGNWLQDTFRVYTTVRSDEQFMDHWDYDTFRDTYEFGNQAPSRPVVFTVAPDKSLIMGPAPDIAYKIYGQYQQAPQKLVNGTDVPGMPDYFHLAIVWRAVIKYGIYEASPEMVEAGKAEWKRLWNDLLDDQTPPMRWGRPVA